MMGGVFSRNRSPATELERIALEIGDLKQQLQKLSNKQSSTLYYLCIFVFSITTFFISHSWLRYDHPKRTYAVGALSIGAIAVVLIGRYFINAFFGWRANRTTQKLEHAISQKAVLLDLVKETLKFKEAKEILDRYETDENLSGDKLVNRSAPTSPSQSSRVLKRGITDSNKTMDESTKNVKELKSPISQTSPQPPTLPPSRSSSSANNLQTTPFRQGHPNAGPIRPYLRQNGPLDKILDYFMSDGPSFRNALVCSLCHTHNGMAMMAEYPYISFKCFECGHMNMAKRAGQPMPVARAVAVGINDTKRASQRAKMSENQAEQQKSEPTDSEDKGKIEKNE